MVTVIWLSSPARDTPSGRYCFRSILTLRSESAPSMFSSVFGMVMELIPARSDLSPTTSTELMLDSMPV